ncbi:MAG: translation initiation factor IF-2 subunit alpha [Candidatus Norongarragalinales archaeon]
MNYPQLDEFLVGTVKKIMPFGAVIALDEYGGLEAFVHISEVSSGWVRNIREHLKEGQKVVVKTIFVDAGKRQIDVSIKRVSEGEKKRKLEAFQNEKRAQKLFERTAAKLGKTMQAALMEAGAPLQREYGSLWAVFQALAAGEELKTQTPLPKMWVAALKETASAEIKPKHAQIRALITAKSIAGDGVERVKAVLEKIDATKSEGVKTRIHYVSAPHYFLDVDAPDYKTAEKFLQKAAAAGEAAAKQQGVEFAIEKQEKA